MPRWMFFVPVITLIAASAVLGLSLGRKALRGTETDVIVQTADRYVAEVGGNARPSDCTARPAASDGLWLVVSCAAQGQGGRDYFIDRFGRVKHVGEVSAQ